jgi:arylsulfatase A-like enzyme
VADATALNIDIAPTVLGAAAAAIPERMQGLDLARIYLRDDPAARRDEFFYEHPTITSKDRIPTSQAVVRRDWKYVQWPEWDYEQLFNLRDDPGELVNLASDPGHAAERRDFHGRLEAWRQRAR